MWRWLVSLFCKSAENGDGGTVFLVDREGVCYKPERRVVLKARPLSETAWDMPDPADFLRRRRFRSR